LAGWLNREQRRILELGHLIAYSAENPRIDILECKVSLTN
jgi:hypothetical protein